MEVQIKRFEPFKVAYIRHYGPYSDCCGAWDKLCAYAQPKGLFKPETRMMGLCHDDPDNTPPEKIRYDASMTVDEGFQAEGPLSVQTVEGGDYAVTVLKGPYDKLAETYRWLYCEWLSSSGRECKESPSLEIYLTDPTTTPPEESLTEIRIPLK